jgi:hypothetical protein
MERVYFLGTVIAFLLLLLVGQVAAQEQIFKKEFMTPDRGSETKLSYLLEKLVNSYEVEGQEGANSFASLHDLSIREGLVKVILVIDADPLKELSDSLLFDFRNRIETVGGKIEGHAFNYISAWLPILSLPEAKDWPQIKSIREPTRPRINDSNNIKKDKLKNTFAQTSIVSEGVSIIGADIWQEKGYTGRGIKVGIIDIGFKGYKELLGKELPSRENVFTKVFGTQTDFLSTEHGTACAEIIHDVAPEADLYLVNITDSEVDFKNAVDWLEGRGVKIVNHSACLRPIDSFLNEELKKQIKDGVIGPCVDEGVVWVQAAGNFAQIGWIGRFYDSDGNKFHEWKEIYELNFLGIHESTEEVLVVLSWDDPEGASNNDYDLYIFKIDEEVSYPEDVIAFSENTQDGDDDPIEDCLFTPQSGKSYGIAIRRYAGVSKTLQLIVFTTKGPESGKLQYYYPRSSIIFSSPADDPSVITVGAVPWDDPHSIEPYSSQGPTSEGLIKPDLVAPVRVSTFSYEKFYGTSASTPHVASACALVLQAYPNYSPSQVKGFLEERSLDCGDIGKDNVYGSGLIQLGEPLDKTKNIQCW